MNNSIGRKLFLWNLLLVLIVVMTAYFGITFFSEDIYINRTEKTIEKEVQAIDMTLQSGDVESVIERIGKSAYRFGATITLYSGDGDLLYSTMQKGNGFGGGFGSATGGMGMGMGMGKHSDTSLNQLSPLITMSGKSVLSYQSILSNGQQLSIQLPREKMSDALSVFKELLLYVGLIAMLVSLVGSYLLSKHFSRPIVSLKELASAISRFDFSGHYSEERRDEIGILGNHLNILSKELEQKINQLEIELHKEKSMDTMRTQFVAQASHELQTPLTILRNYIEAMEDGLIEAEALKEHFKVMTDEIDDMSDLVTGLLDLSQLRSGHFRLAFETFDMERMIAEEVQSAENRAHKAGLTIDSQLVAKNAWVHGDPKRLKQVFRNLLDNSFKHSTGEIYIRSEIIDKDYCISIENSGDKIPKKDLVSLWEVFVKAQGNYKKGRGIGLAIVKAILEEHGGSYGIENTDRGVKSYFTLDLR